MSIAYLPTTSQEAVLRSVTRICSHCHRPFLYRVENAENERSAPVDWICRDCFPTWVMQFEDSMMARHPDRKARHA